MAKVGYTPSLKLDGRLGKGATGILSLSSRKLGSSSRLKNTPHIGRASRCWVANTNDKCPILYLMGMLVRIKLYIPCKRAL